MAESDKVVEDKVVEEVKPDGTKTTTTTKKLGSAGGGAAYSFGTCLAIVISYVKWKSIGWAVFHGFLSWVYVIYYAIKY